MSHVRIASTPNSKQRTGTPGAHPLPTGWEPKGRTVARLARRLGVSGEEVVRQYLDGFKRIAIGRGFMYRDWDTAFAFCVRKDWAEVRTPGNGDE